MNAAKKLQQMSEYEQDVPEILRPYLMWDKMIICDSRTPSEVLAYALEDGYNHICQTEHPYFKADINTAAFMLGKAKQFIDFPLSAIFSPTKVDAETERQYELYRYHFDKAVEKSPVLDAIYEILSKRAVSQTISSDIASIADELFTNAVFNAPFMDLANTKSGADREDQSVAMHKGKKASVFLGANHERIVIGCRDPYGSLNLMKLLGRVKKCYDTNVAENINMTGKGGAGIGSFMVFNSATSYYAVVEKGECTMICCALPLKMNSRTRAVLPKNLHFIIKD